MKIIQINFEQFVIAYKTINTSHIKTDVFIKIIKTHGCFHEKLEEKHSRWKGTHRVDPPPKPQHLTRPKIGGTDTSHRAIFKKELVSILNKATITNIENISNKVVTLFKMEHAEDFITILWGYFKQQQIFQTVYIQLLEDIYNTLSVDDIIEMNISWTKLWNTYIKKSEWHIDYKLIEDSHNYDDFCEYIKEKKKLNAAAEGWSRLMKLGIINTEQFCWVNDVIEYCNTLDLTNIVHKSMLDSYIEQIRDYCKISYEKVPSAVIEKLEVIKDRTLLKSTKFKIVDFIDAVKKMRSKST